MGDPISWGALAVVLFGLVAVLAVRYARGRAAEPALRQAPAASGGGGDTPREQTDAPPATSLYTRLGGEPAISSVVDDLYRRLLIDPSLAPVFEGVDLDRLRRHQVLFFAYALGGPSRYTGRRLAKAHEGLGITEAQFGAVAGHLSASLAAHDVPQPLIDEVISSVAGLQPEVVGR
jgi:hemoglobin